MQLIRDRMSSAHPNRRRRGVQFLGLALATIVFALMAIDRDPIGMIQGRFYGQSEVMASLSSSRLDQQERGAAYFAYGDFSALSSDTLKISAAPWVLTTSLLALRETDGDPERVDHSLVKKAFQSFGFLYPTRIGNWPLDDASLATDQPIGQNVGFAARLLPPVGVTVGNMGCAACHAGVTYDERGYPETDRVWLGSPNTSINLEGYTSALFDAMSRFAEDDARLWAAVDRLYPNLSRRERWTLDYLILPALRDRVSELGSSIGRLIPFRTSLAGATNGLDSLKRRLGLLPENVFQEISIFNSIPDLGDRIFRTAFLNTGSYRIPNVEPNRRLERDDVTEEHRADLGAIVAYFTVPSMGVTADIAEQHIDDTTAIMHWLAVYRPQPFPASINETLAAQGAALYRQHCASCHGEYDDLADGPRLIAFPNWTGDIGTDPLRASLFDQALAEAVNQSLFGRYIDSRVVDGYAAPPLTGIWSSAPYFHNGSVPTLWHLMNPDERPDIFDVGGHAVDLAYVGIGGREGHDNSWLYPEDYQPWSEPVLIDTTEPGLSHDGHEEPFVRLSDSEKWALIEFLKLL